jgi:DNA-binding response OmpR family regulator
MTATVEAPLRVLVIEDESTIIEFLRVGLTYEHSEVEIAQDGPAGLALAKQRDFDLIILDVMLPSLDGFEVCRQLRASGRDVPIIMLTARKEVPDRVTGLNLGADDYLTKPFSFDELLARIRAVLRRRGQSSEPPILRALDLALQPETHEAYKNDVSLELTPIEFALLELFMRHPRRVFTRETLLNRVWGYDYVGDTNVVDVHVGHLRDKIGDRARRLIHTVYGVGYSFRPDDADSLA